VVSEQTPDRIGIGDGPTAPCRVVGLDMTSGGEAAMVSVHRDGHGVMHIARHDPPRVLSQCGALSDVLTDLERIAERSPDPDSRMWARGAIHTLARTWEPDEDGDGG
jgi:hypothetical protein